jgi:Na+/H+-dicarboxylate symporter
MKLPSLNNQILLGAVLGVAIGFYFHTLNVGNLGEHNQLLRGGLYSASIVGTLFIDLLKMILIPLLNYRGYC